MKENDTLRLVQAFVVSRITHAAPYVLMNKGEDSQVDTIIRKAVKQAIRVPMSASTDELLLMALGNTVVEVVEGHIYPTKNIG